jgi:hypothetical protein
MTETGKWRYFVLQDRGEPPYGVVRQRGPEIERWSPGRQCWYKAMFHADLFWRGEPGKRPATPADLDELLNSPRLPDLDLATIDELNDSKR